MKRKTNNNRKIIPFNIALCFLGVFLFLGMPHEVSAGDKHPKQDDLINALESAYTEAKEKVDGTVDIDLAEISGIVQEGDLLAVNYSLSLETGELLRTNIPGFSEDTAKTKAAEYQESPLKTPLTVLAGKREQFPGIHDTVLGMKTGETRQAVVLPEDAYGPRTDDKVKIFSSTRKVPRMTRLTQEEFIEQFRSTPEKGGTVRIIPYFDHKIVDITGGQVILEADVKGRFISKDEFGDTSIVLKDDSVIITLEPKLGADFNVDTETGKIVSIDEKTFTVDCNHPLAGKNLVLDIDVISVSKASSLTDWEISWHEDHDEGLAVADKTGKPVVLVLYASWCPWSGKLFDETLKDTRVTMLRDEFIWIKGNSDKDQSLKELYGQDGFPFIVIMDADGRVVKKISGFKYAYDMRDELRLAMLDMGITQKTENGN
ncbi:MAG: thioredoxin family protein [Deltaproteobacteria bacterium]|nr:thioredoxin family protein [Deltaproteobacteria bacterium]